MRWPRRGHVADVAQAEPTGHLRRRPAHGRGQGPGQVAHGGDPPLVELLGGDRAHPPEPPHGERAQEGLLLSRGDHHQAVLRREVEVLLKTQTSLY